MGKLVTNEQIARAIANNLLSKYGIKNEAPVKWSEVDINARESRGRVTSFDDFKLAIKRDGLLSSNKVIREKWDNMVAIGAIRPSSGSAKPVIVLKVIKELVPELYKIPFEQGAHTHTHTYAKGECE